MRDRGAFWPAQPDWATARLGGAGVEIVASEPGGAAWLVSGDLAAFAAAHKLPPPVGPREVTRSGGYCLRLAPDRLLALMPRPAPVLFGWQALGYGLSDVSDGLVLLDLSGPAAGAVLAHGTGYDLAAREERPMESAQMLLAEQRVILGRREKGWRLHVERPAAAGLWRWLERVAGSTPAA